MLAQHSQPRRARLLSTSSKRKLQSGFPMGKPNREKHRSDHLAAALYCFSRRLRPRSCRAGCQRRHGPARSAFPSRLPPIREHRRSATSSLVRKTEPAGQRPPPSHFRQGAHRITPNLSGTLPPGRRRHLRLLSSPMAPLMVATKRRWPSRSSAMKKSLGPPTDRPRLIFESDYLFLPEIASPSILSGMAPTR